MPLQNQHGDCFVAFTDISGFKALMGGNKALEALNHFYNEGYYCLQENTGIQGMFVSDCGVLFSKNYNYSIQEQLELILGVIRDLNRRMLRYDIMLTTSIAYGGFSYHNRIETINIQKNPIYGNAYLEAFLDNENGNPKIQPGNCRIVKKNLPDEVIGYIQNNEELEELKNHYNYFWMCNSSSIAEFKADYNDTYNMKYRGMLHSLKKATNLI